MYTCCNCKRQMPGAPTEVGQKRFGPASKLRYQPSVKTWCPACFDALTRFNEAASRNDQRELRSRLQASGDYPRLPQAVRSLLDYRCGTEMDETVDTARARLAACSAK